MGNKTIEKISLIDEIIEEYGKKSEKDPLITIRNLKQYFPVKGSKNEFVKANDGITLDIYKGETLGVVGESGCGKSTLGRVLLQLYKQTDGETMYFGTGREDLAPNYAYETFKGLENNIKQANELVEQAEKVRYELDYMENSKHNDEEFFEKREEYENISKEAHNAFLNIAELIGGFYIVKDYDRVSKAHIDHYEECKKLVDLRDELKGIVLDYEDEKIKAEEKNKKFTKENEFAPKIEAKKREIEAQDLRVLEKQKVIDDLRNEYDDNVDFKRYDSLRNNGINLARLEYNEMRKFRKDLQLIFQDPYSSLNPRFTIGQIIGEGLITHKYYKRNSKKSQERIMEVMEDCGLASYMIHRYPHQFSGGQRQRIGIARSLAVKPKFVVCDEAVSALDVSIQSQVINLLVDLKEQENLTYMFISHDLSVVKYISDRIAVMYLGNIVELANSADLFSNPLHPYTEALLAAIPSVDTEEKEEFPLLEGDVPSPINPPSGCKFHTRCRYVMDICKVVTPEFVELEDEHFVACHYRTMDRDKK